MSMPAASALLRTRSWMGLVFSRVSQVVDKVGISPGPWEFLPNWGTSRGCRESYNTHILMTLYGQGLYGTPLALRGGRRAYGRTQSGRRQAGGGSGQRSRGGRFPTGSNGRGSPSQGRRIQRR